MDHPRVSADKEYLRTTLKEASKGDPFTGRLLALMNDVDTQRGARTDPVKLIINRSDYMVDEPSGGILQVEINMISASFACLSTQVAKLHRQTVGKVLEGVLESERVPANAATDGLAEGIAAAHSAMVRTFFSLFLLLFFAFTYLTIADCRLFTDTKMARFA